MSEILKKMSETARANSLCVYSICEIKDGRSETVNIVPSSNCHNCYSVAKVFAVTAIGMLEDRGLLHTDDLVYPLFRDQFPKNFDPRWKKVTIAHAMTHTIGLGIGGMLDIDCQYAPDYPSDDYLSILFGTPLEHEPGTTFVYTDAAFYLVSRVVTAVCGEKLDDFLAGELLVPLRFREFAFSKCPKGYPIGATGLYIATEDMAKLGLLYLRSGELNGRRYLSERFVRKTLGRFELKASCGGYSKGGMNGQLLHLNPSTDRVIAIHSHQGQPDRLMKVLEDENML